MKNSKPSKALGPDNLAPIHLKHLSYFSISILKLFNNIVNTYTIPTSWKTAKIISILIPKKTLINTHPIDQYHFYLPSQKHSNQILLILYPWERRFTESPSIIRASPPPPLGFDHKDSGSNAVGTVM